MDHQKQKLVRAFESHLSGDIESAYDIYKDVMVADPGGIFAPVLINLIQMQSVHLRSSKLAALLNLKRNGFMPATVIDVGAQVGTQPLYEAFPEAHHVMLEPVQENESVLQGICQSLKSAECMMVAVTSRSGMVSLSVTDSLQYSSIAEQIGDPLNNRLVQAVSLNDLCNSGGYSGPFLIKIDVDGVEIEVLKGASTLINPESIFVVEAAMLVDQPRFPKIIDFFRPYGFVLHDIVDHLYRPSDSVLWQVDVVMVHEDHPVRQKHYYV
ncbi:FkbM family methyltransferase [Thiobaca trueperi]|uniref:FkbM family methyltransferase n=1 Tax=Thiobaca trueperi TaxID=127458 RepID=A0A4R3MZN2_9GAMM|nr:FkbM family methyltransferase [Thiobaca trueperi]TCT21327.1 FkbM family methyltransferase [Thiobaca trueperi]